MAISGAALSLGAALASAQDDASVQATTVLAPATVVVAVETDPWVTDEFEFRFAGTYQSLDPGGAAEELAEAFGALAPFGSSSDSGLAALGVRLNLDEGHSLTLPPNVTGGLHALFPSQVPGDTPESTPGGPLDGAVVSTDATLPPVLDPFGSGFPVTLVDPGSGFELTDIVCDEFVLPTPDPGGPFDPLGGLVSGFAALGAAEPGPTPSSVDVASRSAYLGIDPEEVVFCNFRVQATTASEDADLAGDDGDSDQDARDLELRVLPRQGVWTIENVESAMRCAGRTINVGNARPDRITLALRDDGARLVGRGSLEGQNKRLILNAAGNDQYKGNVKAKMQGTRTTISYSWRVLSPERMVGTAKAKVREQGVSCTITRQLKATYQGPS